MSGSVDSLIADCELRARADGAFVGSADHLGLMQAFTDERVSAARLAWCDYSHSERSGDGVSIGIKRPSNYGISSASGRVRLAAQYLVHEIHHALHSDYAALDAFRLKVFTARAEGPERMNPEWVEDLCNLLEDARLLIRARLEDPEDVDHLVAVHRTSVEENVREYEAVHRESPWGSSPADSAMQLSHALRALILLDERFEVDDANAAALKEMERHVEVSGAGPFAAVAAAAEEIEQIFLRTHSPNVPSQGP